jgi:ATP-dependent Lhr-like helicase
VLDALWDLVWAGEVTNDTFAPLRALRWKRTGSSGRRPGGRPGRLTALGPPEAAGRWSLVAPPAAVDRAGATERLHAQSLALLERHGVLTREAVVSEGIDGGFSGVYPVLRALEEAGRIRRGYFVDGLGAAQFALAGALDRLRALRDAADPPSTGTVQLLAAADPANPYGAALGWPRRGENDRRPLQRAAGAYVVLVDGVAALYLERGGATLQRLPAADDPEVGVVAARALAGLVADGRVRELVIRKVDGEAVGVSPFRRVLLDAGFAAGYRGLVLRSPRAGA